MLAIQIRELESLLLCLRNGVSCLSPDHLSLSAAACVPVRAGVGADETRRGQGRWSGV